jgi:hypothetical protein
MPKDIKNKKWYQDPRKLAIIGGTAAGLGLGGYFGYKGLKEAGYDIPRIANIIRHQGEQAVKNFDPQDYINPIVAQRPPSLNVLNEWTWQAPLRKKYWYEKIF